MNTKLRPLFSRAALTFAGAILAAGCASAPNVTGEVSSWGSAPEITNPEEVEQVLMREYRASGLMEQGVEGTTIVWMFVNERGRVEDVRIGTSSGNEAVDQAALRVARVYRFKPALRRNKPVPRWIGLPITFAAR